MTALGIAICVGFAVLSFTIVDGLRSSTYAVSEQFHVKGTLIAREGLEPFDPIAYGIRDGTFVLLTRGKLIDGSDITLAAFEARDLRPPPDGVVRPGAALRLPAGNVTLRSPTSAELAVGAPVRLAFSQAHWGVVSPVTLRSIDPSIGAHRVSYVLAGELDDPESKRLQAEGFRVDPVPSVLPFFESGVAEVVKDTAFIVAFSAVLVAVLSFEFMHLETQDKRREIGIWRALGMRRRDVVGLLLGQAALLAGAGILLGSIAAVAAVFAAKRATGLALLDPRPNLLLLALVGVAILAAALAGACVPAWKTARASVREALEARP